MIGLLNAIISSELYSLKAVQFQEIQLDDTKVLRLTKFVESSDGISKITEGDWKAMQRSMTKVCMQ